MNRRSFLASLPTASALAAAQPMNIIFIVADDLNTALGCYGNSVVKTPNLDRLAARAVRFDRAYCQFPLCAPSRASFLSGRRPDTTHVWVNQTPIRKYMQDVVLLPEFFRKRGYYCAQIGKIFHTGRENEDPRSWDSSVEESGKRPPAEEILERHGMPEPLTATTEWAKLKTPDEKTPDGIVARKAAELMRKLTKEKRTFFMGIGFRRPHAPYAAPVKYFDLYTPSKIPLPEVPPGHEKGLLPAAKFELEDRVRFTDEQTRQYIAAYYACVSFMDAQVGHVLRTVDELDLWRNTAIVFIGDQGYHNGEHGMWHKMTLFEQSTRGPLLIHAPLRKGMGGVCRGLVEYVDIYPTLAEVCGYPVPSELQGVSLAPWLDSPARPVKKAVFSMVGRADGKSATSRVAYLGRTVRTERWRYTEWDEGRRGAELYDEQNDPKELQNLAANPKLGSVVAELRELLRRGAGSASGK